MAIDVMWFNEDETGILWVFADPWQLEDYHSAIRATAKLIRNMPEDYRFFTVSDLRQSNDMPRNFITTVIRQHARNGPQYVGTIHYGESAFLRAMLRVMQNVKGIGNIYYFVKDAGEAQALIDDWMKKHKSAD